MRVDLVSREPLPLALGLLDEAGDENLIGAENGSASSGVPAASAGEGDEDYVKTDGSSDDDDARSAPRPALSTPSGTDRGEDDGKDKASSSSGTSSASSEHEDESDDTSNVPSPAEATAASFEVDLSHLYRHTRIGTLHVIKLEGITMRRPSSRRGQGCAAASSPACAEPMAPPSA